VPGDALFATLRGAKEESGQCTLPLVAEDLGVITDEVIALRDQFGLPGMRVLQFGFDGNPGNPHVPHNYVPHCVVYTGTHDNNTTLGWFKEQPTSIQQYICEYLHAHPYDMPWPMIEAALASVAKLVMLPMQDILAADADQRMNTPGTPIGNWQWRLDWQQLPFGVQERLKRFLKFYERV
jgi:4-alpha-glucanotransferase